MQPTGKKSGTVSWLLCIALGLGSIGLPLQPASAKTLPASISQQDFSQWQQQFRSKALALGISRQLLDQAFSGLQPDPSIIQADSNQPEHVRPVWQYLKSAISPWRVARGKALLAEHRRTLDKIEQQYRVDRHILIAIWGLESNFGKNTGDKHIVRSLATLAAQGRRAEFWEQQLLAALKILENGDISLEDMRGSWAGAMGQTQFIPTTYLDFAVDFDGDGKRDIWNSTDDALASTANYLHKSGWQQEQHWGYEARLPALFDYMSADGKESKTIAQWLELGVELRQKQQLTPEQLQQRASIVLPAGYRGPAFVQPDNFRSLLKYNRSTSYVLAVGLLGDSLRGEVFSLQRWPQQDQPMSRSQRLETQQLLIRLGYLDDKADGIIGKNSQQAIRKFQLDHDLPADGYPSIRLLERIRQIARR